MTGDWYYEGQQEQRRWCVRYDQQDERERTALATSHRPGFRLENTCSVCGHHRTSKKHDSRICSPIAERAREFWSDAMKKVAELEGAALDYWVAKASGFLPEPLPNGMIVVEIEGNKTFFMPSTEWNQGAPIIEKEKITLQPLYNQKPEFIGWSAKSKSYWLDMEGATPLIAAMRAYVASVYGEAVEEITGE